MPEEDDSSTVGFKTLRETLDINAMKQLRNTTAVFGGGASSTKSAPAEISAMPPKKVCVHRVVIIMEAM